MLSIINHFIISSQSNTPSPLFFKIKNTPLYILDVEIG